MKLILAFGIFLTIAVNAQTVCVGMVIEPPLVCTTDAGGQHHLGVSPQTVTIKTSRTVRGEVPARSSDGKGWTLKGQPVSGVTCWRNGAHQTSGVDYVLAAADPYITSAVWTPDDTLACDYETAK